MRNLKIEELQVVNGGGVAGAIDGACVSVSVAGLAGLAVPGLNAAVVACTVWGIGRVIY